MSRIQRRVVYFSAGAWVVSVGLMFTQLLTLTDPWSDFWRVASINAGALAACMTTVAVLPYMLREFYQGKVSDYVGAYLAGWAKSQEGEPLEPVRLHVVGE